MSYERSEGTILKTKTSDFSDFTMHFNQNVMIQSLFYNFAHDFFKVAYLEAPESV